MDPPVDAALVRLFGSETRALSLAVLANAKRPMTAYRVAKTAGLGKIKVYQQLKALVAAGWIERGGNRYVLPAGELRSLLRTRVRVSWSADWSADRAAKDRRASRLVRRAPWRAWYRPADFVPNPTIARRYAEEFERPAAKDRPFGSGRGVGSRKQR